MARLNIEESIFKDTRFIDFCIFIGDREKALGALVQMWIMAQKFFLKFGEIPKEEWIKHNLNDSLIKFGLAERTSTGVRAKGQNEQFAWLIQASAAGKKSAELRGNAQHKKHRTVVRKKGNLRSTVVEGSPTSSLSTPSSLLTTPNSLISTMYENKNFHREKIASFCRAWRYKYNAQYKFLPKELGIMKSQFKDTTLENFERLVEAYFQMNNAKFISKRHSFTEFYFSLQEVNHFMQTGVKVSKFDASQIELNEHNNNVFTRLTNKE